MEFGSGVPMAGGRTRVPAAGTDVLASGAVALQPPLSRSWEEGGALGGGGRGRWEVVGGRERAEWAGKTQA